MSVAGPFVPRQPPAWPLVGSAGEGGGGDDDPIRRWHKSTHEADVEAINVQQLDMVCAEPCLLGFWSLKSLRAHHGDPSARRHHIFLTLRADPRYGRFVVAERYTRDQLAAIVGVHPSQIHDAPF